MFELSVPNTDGVELKPKLFRSLLEALGPSANRSDCQQDYMNTTEWISIKPGGSTGHRPRKYLLNSGADPDKGMDEGIFFISFFNNVRYPNPHQPEITHSNLPDADFYLNLH